MREFRNILLTICLLTLAINTQSQTIDEGTKNDEKIYAVKHLGRNINTKFSESGACVIDDTLFLFSSMREMEESGSFLEQQPMLIQIFQSVIDTNGTPRPSTLFSTQINSPKKHTYNAAYDSRNKILYYTYCEANDDDVGHCVIYYATRSGNKWTGIRRLGGSVNNAGNNTHPAVGYLPDGSTILYFSSDRAGGLGGYDIWYAIIRHGKVTVCANLGTPVNSEADEVTPFYDNEDGVLYFSSNKSDGLGEYDIYYSYGNRDNWTPPVNMGDIVNSAYNDIFFTVSPPSSPSSKTPGLIKHGHLSSNRKDSFFATDSSCCNDIYHWELVEKKNQNVETEKLEKKIREDTINIEVNFQQVARSLLPISLFFHNDEPDPRSMATTTATTYYQTYNRYMFLKEEYMQAWENEADSAIKNHQQDGLKRFFDNEVQGNCDRLESFLFFLSEDLAAGKNVSLTVSGYASQLHTSSYNERLSKRRISSIVNQMREWHGGTLRRYIDNGQLQLSEVPYGSTQSMEKTGANHNKNHSVYSIEACHERRIDIVDYTYF